MSSHQHDSHFRCRHMPSVMSWRMSASRPQAGVPSAGALTQVRVLQVPAAHSVACARHLESPGPACRCPRQHCQGLLIRHSLQLRTCSNNRITISIPSGGLGRARGALVQPIGNRPHRGGRACCPPTLSRISDRQCLRVALRPATQGVTMPSRQEAFRAQAAECEELAKQVRDPEVKRQYEDLARHWREMADRADRRSW
jgi:hypothetical protein